jgi:SIR2-like domain
MLDDIQTKVSGGRFARVRIIQMEGETPQNIEHTRIPNQLLNAVRERSCILWAGAGFSLEASFPGGAKLPNGRALAYHLAGKTYQEGRREQPRLDEHLDLQIEAELFEDTFQRRELVLELFGIFGKEGLAPGEAHDLAIKLFPIIVTTNYDSLFERAVYSHNKQPMIVRGDFQISLIGAGNWSTIIKLHGDLNDPDRIVITARDYHDKAFSPSMRTWLTAQLLNRTILFMGYTLDDEDFRDVYLKRVIAELPAGFKPPGFLVAPVSSDDPEESKRWELRRQEWGQHVRFLSGTAGVFLKELEHELEG